jgi:hypothetical protein
LRKFEYRDPDIFFIRHPVHPVHPVEMSGSPHLSSGKLAGNLVIEQHPVLPLRRRAAARISSWARFRGCVRACDLEGWLEGETRDPRALTNR